MGRRHLALSVSGGAYCYQMGIALHIQQHFDLDDILFSGASGGSWPALLLAAKVDVRYAFEVMMLKAVPCYFGKTFGAYGSYDNGMKAAFYHIFDGVDLPSKVNGKLAICVTRIELWPYPHLVNEMVSHFTSNDDIIECIIASALIPFALNGKPFVIYRNWICIDGGMTNISGVRTYTLPTQLDFDEDTTRADSMRVVSRLQAVLSLFSRMRSSARAIPRFHAPGGYPFQYPATVGPFGAFGHSVTIIKSVAQEVYHALLERLEQCPSSMKDKLFELFRKCNEVREDAAMDLESRDHMLACNGVADTDRGSESKAMTQETLFQILPFELLNWVFSAKTAIGVRMSVSDGPSRVASDAASSWWERNRFQLETRRCDEEAITADVEVADNDLSTKECNSAMSSYVLYSSTTDLSVIEVDHGNEFCEKSLRPPSPEQAGGCMAESYTAIIPSVDSIVSLDIVSSLPSDVDRSEQDAIRADENSSTSDDQPLQGSKGLSDGRNALMRTNTKRVYWRKKAEAVRVTPCGGTELLITPWMWRKLPISAYHLTSKGDKAAALMELGLIDAAEHHLELVKFFSPDDYVKLLNQPDI